MFTYLPNGNLTPGILETDWDSFIAEFGKSLHRKSLIDGLILAITHLQRCGCVWIYLDGSFISKASLPNDYDLCYDDSDIELNDLFVMYPKICTGTREMHILEYRGQLKNMGHPADWENIFLDYFQKDKYDNSPKGIIKINISRLNFEE